MHRLTLVCCVCIAVAVDLDLMLQDNTLLKTHLAIKRYTRTRKYQPRFHITSPIGWLNDPSGFVYFKRKYHIFYQVHPFNGAWGTVHWGHVASKNLIDWFHYPTALAPRKPYEQHGCLAGSVIVYNNYMTVFYTGDLHTSNRTLQSQNVAISSNGIMFQKYLYNPIIKPLLKGSDEIKNPKVWRNRNTWYMLVGTSTDDRRGCIVLFTSVDLFTWSYSGTVAESMGDMGYVWENPDLFELDGQHVLILSVQGMQADGYRYKNLYQTGYVVGRFNYETGKFDDSEISTATFNELDYGHDFHGVQSLEAPDGRRLLVGWLGMWDVEPEEFKDGWSSFLTLIREISLTAHGKLLMNPVREMEALRAEVLESAWYSPGEAFAAGTKSFEMLVKSNAVVKDVVITLEWEGPMNTYYTIGYYSQQSSVSVNRGGVDGVRKVDWWPGSEVTFRIFVDVSAVEVFCGNGEVVFSSRIYPRKSIHVKVEGDTTVHITQYKLRRNMLQYKSVRSFLKDNYLKLRKKGGKGRYLKDIAKSEVR